MYIFKSASFIILVLNIVLIILETEGGHQKKMYNGRLKLIRGSQVFTRV